MMSACDIAFRGNPGNTSSSILPNLVFERRPLHARHVFLFHISYHILVFFNKIKPVIFFLCFHYLTCLECAPQLSPQESSTFLLFRCTYLFGAPQRRLPWCTQPYFLSFSSSKHHHNKIVLTKRSTMTKMSMDMSMIMKQNCMVAMTVLEEWYVRLFAC
jgi:hypothetical protein